jgi:hypothetical protein
MAKLDWRRAKGDDGGRFNSVIDADLDDPRIRKQEQEGGAAIREYMRGLRLKKDTVVGETVWYTRLEHDEAEVEAWGIYNTSKAIFDAWSRR